MKTRPFAFLRALQATPFSRLSWVPWFFLISLPASAEVGQWFAGKLLADEPVALRLSASAALSPWRMMGVSGMTEQEDGTRDVAFSASGAPRIPGTYRMRDGVNPGEVEAEWVFTPEGDLRMEMFGLMGDLQMDDYGGGTLLVDGSPVSFPKKGTPENVRRNGISRLSIMDVDGAKRLDFAFREPIDLFVQYWGGSEMSLRFIFPPDNRLLSLYRGGRARTLAFTLTGAGPFRKSTLKPMTVAAGPEWIPFAASNIVAAGSPLDFSDMRPTGKPCGAFGRVVSRGPHFEFEKRPGVPQRFYGVNLCEDANYPKTLEDARTLARILARTGYNTVRIHHHDGLCIDKTDPAGVRLDEEMMRRMDALVTACNEEGIYLSTDLYVSRSRTPIAWRAVGVDRDGNLSQEDMKHSVPVHEGFYANYIAFATNWLGHVNVFTGRRYAEEPALAWISLVNEGNVDGLSGPVFASSPGWQEAWDAWLAEKKAADPKMWGDITSELPNGLGRNRQGRAFLVFLQDVETRFAERTRRILADMGCKALVTDMNNWGQMSAALEKVRAEEFDYVDTHFYVDHPSFLEKSWRPPSWCPNENIFRGRSAGAAMMSAVRILDRPFTVSEYNYCGPGRYRGVGGIATGAEAALQDWAGLWRFAWAHNLGAALHPGTGGLGYFNLAVDPLQLASERASICLFLRGDAEPLETTYAVTLPLDRISSPDSMIGESPRVSWVAAAWHAKIGNIVGSEPPAGAIHAGDFDKAYIKSPDEVLRELGVAGKHGAVSPVVVENGTFLINTPRTCGVFAEGGAHTAGVLTVNLGGASSAERAPEETPHAKEVPATIWASSLDGESLATSSRILVTHLTDVQNTDASYADADMTIIKSYGHLPYLMRAGKAEIELKVDSVNSVNGVNGANDANSVTPATWRVFALAPDGTRTAEIPATYSGGVLRFTADIARDPENATFLYELVRK